jgi:hypothetical protein
MAEGITLDSDCPLLGIACANPERSGDCSVSAQRTNPRGLPGAKERVYRDAMCFRTKVRCVDHDERQGYTAPEGFWGGVSLRMAPEVGSAIPALLFTHCLHGSL